MPTLRTRDASRREQRWESLPAVLDALAAGLLGADDYIWDDDASDWVRVGDHTGVRAAWEALGTGRPLAAAARDGLAFPALTPDGLTPARGVPVEKGRAEREAAWAAIRAGRAPAAAAPTPIVTRVLVEPGLTEERSLWPGALLMAILAAAALGATVLGVRALKLAMDRTAVEATAVAPDQR